MRTKKAAQPEPTRRTICHGALFNEDTEDSDFPSDQESSSSGVSDLESITSGDYDVLAEGWASVAGGSSRTFLHDELLYKILLRLLRVG